MYGNPRQMQYGRKEATLSGISVGFFFLLVGVIFVINSPPNQPNLLDRVIDFLTHFQTVQVPSMGIYLPAPIAPLRFSALYAAVQQFAFVWGGFQVVKLFLRFIFNSPLNKKAEALGDFAFWVGSGFLIGNFLLDSRWLAVWSALTIWFVCWATIIMLSGITLIIRAVVLASAPKRKTF